MKGDRIINISDYDPYGSVIEFPLTGDEFECLEQILNKYPNILDYDVDICNLSLKICFDKRDSTTTLTIVTELFDDEDKPREVLACKKCGQAYKTRHDVINFCSNCGRKIIGKKPLPNKEVKE